MLLSCMKRGAVVMAPHASMVLVELFVSGLIVMSQAILIQGTSSIVLNFYIFLSGTIFMSILALIFDRKNRPPLNKRLLLCIFLMAFLGVALTQNMAVACLYFISGTIESAIDNTLPIVTYTLSVVSRQEKLELKTWWGRGKLLGTLTSVSGAFALMFWNGPAVLKLSTTMGASNLGYWFLGIAMMFSAILGTSAWIILLRPLTRLYPAEVSLNALMMFFSLLQQSVLAATINHKPYQWRLGWNLELIFIFYAGVSVGLSNILMTWCSATKGPIFVASFMPLCLVFTAILEIVFLHNPLHVGSVVGSIVILFGLYIYLWSKFKEEEAHQSMDGYESIESPPLS